MLFLDFVLENRYHRDNEKYIEKEKEGCLMKKELLSPAGNMESLKAAVHAGADAIYIGGKSFGARKFASNFDREELKEAVRYCHLYGVRLFITVNTMIYETEIEEVMDYLCYLVELSVDAVIVQDIGLIRLIHEYFPTLEIHASTQLHNYQKSSFDLLEELGVKRVVLAREASLGEIEKIETPLEKEVFIHGAICISYSGQCLFSSQVLGRSGNRGECAGMCRLPYSVVDENQEEILPNQYLLSPKDLCTISHFRKLMESDVDSFKIEGRMKSPAYVYYVTRIYRTLMDQYYEGKNLEISEEEWKNLKLLFHRGFTEGHLFDAKDSNFMNVESPNHIGIDLGMVKSFSKKKIEIVLHEDLHQEDGIRFEANGGGMIVNYLYDQKGKLISHAERGQTVWVDNKVGLSTPSKVLKTKDVKLEQELLHYPLRRVPISFSLSAHVGKSLSASISDGVHQVSLEGEVVQLAQNRPTTREEIKKHFCRVGDTCYEIVDGHFDLGQNIFIPMKALHQLRRDLLSMLTAKRLYREKGKTKPFLPEKNEKFLKKDVKLSCLVRTEEQLLVCISSAFRVYVTDFSLYQKYRETYSNLYYRVDRLTPLSTYHKERLLLTEFCQLPHAKDNEVVTDYYYNVSNRSFLSYLKEHSVTSATLSVECPFSSLITLSSSFDCEVIAYGRLEWMIMKHCLFSSKCSSGNLFCQKNSSFFLKDRNHQRYPLVFQNGVTHLFGPCKDFFSKTEIRSLSSYVSSFRLEFLEESKQEVQRILKKYQEWLQIPEFCDKINTRMVNKK